MPETQIDTMNEQLVGLGDGENCITVMRPKSRMTREQALRHAAWLVAVAEHGALWSFNDVLTAIRNT